MLVTRPYRLRYSCFRPHPQTLLFFLQVVEAPDHPYYLRYSCFPPRLRTLLLSPIATDALARSRHHGRALGTYNFIGLDMGPG